ncbi:putative dna replication regulator sld3 protein [Neofusicoccum parvum UCRNP2]|uniref:Putative dna replication regulator sld3 protein n=1 Tax=Botryosphaeria parva (strain UCR-NP2) TaxID=1287680 RepID=R1EEA8_BOTPV|nr:putative dna replication regulator sld3 protein [Neofusicoccum parvum UCRNP2]
MLGSNCPLNRLAHYGPCPTSPYDRPITLAPVKLIERSQLPLSFLDLAGSSSIVPSTRLFSAYVEALERQSTDDDELPPTPKVLITRLEADGSLYAVERVQYGTYALCKLSAWVKEADVGSVPAFAEGLAYTQPLKALKKDDGKGAWWQRAAVSASGEAAAEQKGGLTPRISMRRPVPNIVHTGPQRQEETDPFVDSARQPAFAGQDPVDIPQERPQTAEEVFQAIVQQYLEALYLSKTSLAFFAKGPMSRARAAFTSKDNAGMKMGDLAAFMRSILLQPGPMDKKHREKLPEIIKSMPLPDKLKNFCVEVILPFRNSLSQFERFSRRQIDLEAMSKANEAKLKKKAHIEQELEKAIGTLRKPNRGAALKDVAADTDNRRLSRKPATTTRKPAAAILVGATPKRGRKTKDIVQQQATPNYRWPPGMAALDPDDDVAPPPPSSDAVVPSSAIRPTSAVPASAARSVAPSSSTLPSRTQRGAGPAVEDTPSRGPAGKTVHWLFPPSSGDRGAGVAATPEAGVSRLAEKLAAGAKGALLRPPKPPPAFRLPGEGGRGGDVEDADEGGEEGVGGDGDAGEGRG